MLKRILSGLTAGFFDDPPINEQRDWDLCPFIHPQELSSGYAGHVVDMQGQDYVDCLSAWGTNLLGYGYGPVAEAVSRQALLFNNVGLPYPQFWQLGQRLHALIPAADVFRYGKNGSDATAGAIRLARAVTGREHVATIGYHGFHDWWMASGDCAGIPTALRELIHPMIEFSLHGVKRLIAEHPNQLACLIYDPCVLPFPERSEIESLQEILQSEGVLFILDEVASGFRVAPGGAQELWNIAPDLSCFGKSVANGLPLSVLAGKRHLMEHLPEIKYGMTFEGEAISIAAASATLHEVVEKDICNALAEKGRRLKSYFSELCRGYGIASTFEGFDQRPDVRFAHQAGLHGRELRWLFIQEMVRAKILTLGTFLFCYSHTKDDLDMILQACDQALHTVRRAVQRGSTRDLLDARVFQALRS